MKKFLVLTLALLGALVFRVAAQENPYGLPDGLYSEITTEKGVIVCELYYDKTPMTVMHYVGLAEGTFKALDGKPYYEGSKWHRVIANFVVQGGAGQPGSPRMGSYPDEIVPGLRHDSAGVLEMANSGPDSNGSQYCLMESPQNRLNYNHTVFGHVVRGLEVMPKVQQGDTMHIKILRIGDKTRAFKADDESFNALKAKIPPFGNRPKKNGPDTAFDDPDIILPTNNNYFRVSEFNLKLENYERFTGRKIVGRVLAKTPDNVDDYMHGLQEKLGTAQNGGTAVYFADRDEWKVLLAGDSIPTFVSRSPDGVTPQPAPFPTAEISVKEFLDSVKTRGEAASSRTRSDGEKIKVKVDTMLDSLIFKLEPR